MDHLARQKNLTALYTNPEAVKNFSNAISKLTKLESLNLWNTSSYTLEDEPLSVLFLPSTIKELLMTLTISEEEEYNAFFRILDGLPDLEVLGDKIQLFNVKMRHITSLFDRLEQKDRLYHLSIQIVTADDTKNQIASEILRRVSRLRLQHVSICLPNYPYVQRHEFVQALHSFRFLSSTCHFSFYLDTGKNLTLEESSIVFDQNPFLLYMTIPEFYEPPKRPRYNALEYTWRFQEIVRLGRLCSGLRMTANTRLPLEIIRYILCGSFNDWPSVVEKHFQLIVRCLSDRRTLGLVHTVRREFNCGLLYQRCFTTLEKVKKSAE